jgi:curved DNA-binding protein CbpA
MQISGDLAEGVLPRVLRSLYVGRRTGLLHVTRGEERGSVCFIQGNIVFGESTIKECHLGETLVRHGLLSHWEFERASEVVSVTGKRLGDVLVDLGNLDADGLEDALALHVREVLLTIFSWRDGSYYFDEKAAAVFRGYDRPLRLSTGEVILDAVWSISDPEAISFALGDLDRVPVPASDPLLRFQRLSLTPTDGFILSRVDGVMTAQEILAMAPVGHEEALRSLFGLLYTGMVEFLPKAVPTVPAASRAIRIRVLEAYGRLATGNHFEALGVERKANANEILAAYFRVAKFFHPDSHHEPELADLKDKLEAVFARVTEAHRVLANPQTRAAYEQYLDAVASPSPDKTAAAEPVATEKSPAAAKKAPVAEKAPAVEKAPAPAPEARPEPEAHTSPEKVAETLDVAETALAEGRYWETLALVAEVFAMSSGRTRRRARVLKAQAHLKSEGGRRAAEEELRAALEEDKGNIEAHFCLGNIYKSGGANVLAKGAFERVLALKPRHAGALQALASLEAAPASDAPPKALSKLSGLRKLFGGS